jgi:outer membrane protease
MKKLSHDQVWKITVCLLFISVMGISAEAAGRFQADLSAGSGMISGRTEYSVGGHITTPGGKYQTLFPISKLIFPVDTYLLTLNAGFTCNNRLMASMTWSTGLTDDPGQMKDYDWDVSSGQLSIFSESRLDMDSEMFSGKIQYPFFQADLDHYALFFHQGDQCRLMVGAEYLFRRFDFNAYDTFQTYPGQGIGPDFMSDHTLLYTVDYLIPLMEMGMAVKASGGSSAELCLGYSPYTKAKDEDRHLLRTMRSKADCTGTAILLSCDLRVVFFKQWYAALHLSHLEIETDGISRTITDNEWSHSIDAEIESKHSLATLRIGVGF